MTFSCTHDQHQFSPNKINAKPEGKVMRINNMTNWSLNKFSQVKLLGNERDQSGEFVCGYCRLKGQLHTCKFNPLGLVPERSISANPGLKFCSSFVIYLPTYLGVKAQQYFFSSSCMSLDKKTLLKTRLNPGLNLTIFWGTGPWSSWQYYHHDRIFDYHWLSPWWTQISELVVSVTVGVCVLQKN